MKNVKIFISKSRNRKQKPKQIDILKDRIYSVKRQLNEMEEEEETHDEFMEKLCS